MNRKLASLILGHFEKKCICHHMMNSSFTCFLGHFMLLSVHRRFESHKRQFFLSIPNENRTKLFYLINRLFPCGNWISKRCTPRTTDNIRTNCPVPTGRINVEIEPLIEIDFDISKDYIKKCPADCNIGKLNES